MMDLVKKLRLLDERIGRSRGVGSGKIHFHDTTLHLLSLSSSHWMALVCFAYSVRGFD